MDIITVEHSSNIFWLGRYLERVKTTLIEAFKYHDKAIDIKHDYYKEFLARLGIPEDKYSDADDFLDRFLYDETDPSSVAYAFERVYDNACIMREVLSSQALAFIQLAIDTFKKSRGTSHLRYELLAAKDYIFAFWGCIEDSLPEYDAMTILHCGKHIERLDLCFRLGLPAEDIETEFDKLCNDLAEVKKGNPYAYNTRQLSTLVEVVGARETERYPEAIAALGRLFDPD